MKKVLVVLAVALTFGMNAQKTNQADVFDLGVSIDKQKKMYKSKVEAKSIKFKDASFIKVGDTLTVGASANKISNTYTTLMVGRFTMGGAMLSAPVYYSLTIKDTKVVVDRLKVWRSTGRINVVADLKQLDVSSKAMYKYVGCVNLEIAVTQGEIINPNAPMTRGQAIAKLTEAKGLFDLGMMSKEEYNAIRLEVTPIIKN